MAINKTEKQELLEKLNMLLKKQSLFQQEINELQFQITTLQVDDTEKVISDKTQFPEQQSTNKIISERKEIEKIIQQKRYQQEKTKIKEKKKSEISSELEKFIGENLINKIGIAVLIIGVGIGVKYAIDNDLISPLVRILLGYLVGLGLTFFAIRLKKKYLNFSAVLFSGAMAIHYFITYAAYSYYNLFPQILAIVLMVIITILTVTLALYYNQQVIAHYGLVGAYIVPYLLKEPFENVLILFIYMVIINAGILFISTKKKWKFLNYLAFLATWTIFITWFASENYNNQLGICLLFLTLFFAIFYLVFLSYKLLLKEKFSIDDILFLLINSGILYIVGYIAINSLESSREYLGLFTLINAIIHSITTYIIYKTKSEDKNLFYWTIGMVITFITVAIPVQFNDFITAILWAAEAAAIFWYGRSRKINIYEIISYVIIFILFIITATNWTSVAYNFRSNEIEKLFTPVFNIEFLSSFFVILSFSFIYYVILNSKIEKENSSSPTYIFNLLFPLFVLIIVYFTFFTEINLYWNNIQIKSSFELNRDEIWIKQFGDINKDVFKFKAIWLLNYSLIFASVLSFANFRWIKNKNLNALILVLNFILILTFLVTGLGILAELRESYLNPNLAPDFDVSIFHLIIRYVAYLFFALLVYSTHRFIIPGLENKIFKKVFEITFSITIIWVCSSELINWLSLSGSTEVYKHGLSILWGIFSLLLIAYGIWKKKKHLRITAMVLFGGTLLKLFFYDLTNLDTVPKTIVFLSIGVLLLVVSFLYNKYKHIISEEN
ncbi:MAG: DUF2339 domain-containing protein [Bacteroidetes bacterium]|nr:DUF2339 domain-containing protein [Bacteroidota bacterium]